MSKKNEQNKFPVNLELGKLPPQAIDMEEAVLGGLMLEANAIVEVINILTAESFYQDHHQKIFKTILELFSKNKPIDLLTVPEQLRVYEELDEVGGLAYIAQLSSRVASTAHIEYHAKIVQQKFIMRELIRISSDITAQSFDDSLDPDDVLDWAQTEINKIGENTIRKVGAMIGDIGGKRLKVLSEIMNKTRKSTGIHSWNALDKLTGGFHDSNLTIIAGRPSNGKTRIAQEITRMAADAGNTVAFFSLEMGDEELYDRELSTETGIENMFIRKAEFDKEQWEDIEKAQGVIERRRWLIDDTEALTVTEFRSKSILYKKKYGVNMIIVDYLQLMKSPSYKNNREREIADISSTLKSVAKRLKIPVIALSQLNRGIENRTSKTPHLGDLRESGAIEQDADNVLFVHLPEKYDDPKNIKPENENRIELILAKQRNGVIGVVNLWKTKRWTKITEDEETWEGKKENGEQTDLPY